MTDISEAYLSRDGSTGQNTNRELIYYTFGEPDGEQAQSDLLDGIPFFYPVGLTLLPRRNTRKEQITQDVFKFIVEYGLDQNQTPQSDPDANQFNTTLTFNLVGGTEHITTARKTKSYVPSGGEVIDIKNAIGLDLKTGQVRGVEAYSPLLDYTFTTQFPNRIVTNDYIDALYDLTGTVNAAAFKRRPAGSVLFKGARGSKRGLEMWELAFEFAFRKNKTDIKVGSITVPSKKGWQYLDVLYKEDATKLIGGKAIQVPAQVNVHDIFEDGDFSKMRIGP